MVITLSEACWDGACDDCRHLACRCACHDTPLADPAPHETANEGTPR